MCACVPHMMPVCMRASCMCPMQECIRACVHMCMERASDAVTGVMTGGRSHRRKAFTPEEGVHTTTGAGEEKVSGQVRVR